MPILLGLFFNPQIYAASTLPHAQMVHNLAVFAKVYGCVRYYCPTKQAQLTDWNRFVTHGASMVLMATDKKALVDSLLSIVKPIAPQVQIANRPIVTPAIYHIQHKVKFWQHVGYREPHQPTEAAKTFKSKVVTHSYNKLPVPLKNKEVLSLMFDSIYVSIPMVLSVGNDKPSNNQYGQSDTQMVRLASLIICWNELVHFQPYITDWEKWDTVLNEALLYALNDTSASAYHHSLNLIGSAIGDAHGLVTHNGAPVPLFEAYPPLFCDWIEGKLIVFMHDSSIATHIGDEVISINGLPAKVLIDNQSKVIVGAATQSRLMALSALYCLGGKDSTTLKLICKNSLGEPYSLNVLRLTDPMKNIKVVPVKPKPVIYELEDGLYFVNLSRLTKKELKSGLKVLQSAKGIVCEFRGYPKEPFTALGFVRHLATSDVRGMPFYVPVIYGPRFAGYVPDTSAYKGQWTFSALRPHINCPVVFVTGIWAQSYCETILSIVKTYHLGTVVGENTGGSNGVSNYIELANGYAVQYTAQYMTKQDGSPIYGAGITPDIYCPIPINSIIERRDTVLNKAIEVLRMQLQ